MPQISIESNQRMALRIAPQEKKLIMRAAAIEHTNLTEFALRHLLTAAQKVIDDNERLSLSESDSLHVMELLDNPPEPNKKLLAAAFAMPKSP